MNINVATEEELRGLPGIGEKTAAKIVASRPIGNKEEFGALIPPSALVAIEKGELELAFDVPVVEILDTSVQTDVGIGLVEPIFREGGGDPGPTTAVPALVGRPVEPVLRVEDLRLRRVLRQDTERFESLFDTGARFLCIWNMQWGPALEPRVPGDDSVQKEIAMWFGDKGIEILFAHYGPSVRVGTRSRGLVPLVLFEILEEEKEEEEDVQQSDEGKQGGGGDLLPPVHELAPPGSV